MTKSIFTVKLEKISAELEIDDNMIKCVSGNTTHFEISKDNFRSFLHLKPDKILLNFTQMEMNKLYQITLSSKHTLSILSILKELFKIK